RDGPVDTGLPRPGSAGHAALGVELLGGLAEIPDVAALVLPVPVHRVLDDLALGVVESVVHDGGRHALDVLGPARDRDDVDRGLAVLQAAIAQGRARLEREPWVVDDANEVRPLDVGIGGGTLPARGG